MQGSVDNINGALDQLQKQVNKIADNEGKLLQKIEGLEDTGNEVEKIAEDIAKKIKDLKNGQEGIQKSVDQTNYLTSKDNNPNSEDNKQENPRLTENDKASLDSKNNEDKRSSKAKDNTIQGKQTETPNNELKSNQSNDKTPKQEKVDKKSTTSDDKKQDSKEESKEGKDKSLDQSNKGKDKSLDQSGKGKALPETGTKNPIYLLFSGLAVVAIAGVLWAMGVFNKKDKKKNDK